LGKNIYRTVVDEESSTCIMSIGFWKDLFSPKLDMSAKLLKKIDGQLFQPHGIISVLPINLGGNTLSMEVEVIDSHLEYNMLLMCTWFYEMTSFFSSVFRVLCFPRKGKIILIDQIVFCTPEILSNVGPNVPFVGDTMQSYMSVGVGILKDPSLMGIFPLPPLSPTTNVSPINMIFSFSSGSLRSFYPWVVPHPKDVESFGASMPLTTVNIGDPTIPSTSTDTGQELHSHIKCDQLLFLNGLLTLRVHMTS
jgi:hypothetical protein